jgi:hypothetical protein
LLLPQAPDVRAHGVPILSRAISAVACMERQLLTVGDIADASALKLAGR